MKRQILIIFIGLIVAFGVLAAVFYQKIISQQREIALLETRASQRDIVWQTAKIKSEILNILVTNIILAKEEIPLKVRINMENKIDSTGDQTLRAKWDGFADAEDKAVAQTAMEDLLRYLVEEVNQGLR